MSRTAIIGSCITRDIWRECEIDFEGGREAREVLAPDREDTQTLSPETRKDSSFTTAPRAACPARRGRQVRITATRSAGHPSAWNAARGAVMPQVTPVLG